MMRWDVRNDGILRHYTASQPRKDGLESLKVLFLQSFLWHITDTLTKSMYQNPSCETNSHSASQEISCISMEPEGSLSCSQDPTTDPYPEPTASSPHLPTLFPKDLFQYYLPIYSKVFRIFSSLHVLQPKFCTQVSYFCVLYFLPILSSLSLIP